MLKCVLSVCLWKCVLWYWYSFVCFFFGVIDLLIIVCLGWVFCGIASMLPFFLERAFALVALGAPDMRVGNLDFCHGSLECWCLCTRSSGFIFASYGSVFEAPTAPWRWTEHDISRDAMPMLCHAKQCGHGQWRSTLAPACHFPHVPSKNIMSNGPI